MKKENGILINLLIVIGLILFLTISCKKESNTSQAPTPTPTPSQNSMINFNPNLTYGTVTDIDGNVYKTIVIGSKTYMAENLRVTHYRNGDPIINGNTQWGGAETGKYCDYNNNPSNSLIYGKLYNGYAVYDSRGIAPTGWSVVDLGNLTTYLGGLNVAGGKLKETGISHWQSPNAGATNESGFTALPGGYRSTSTTAEYSLIGYNGFWWGNYYLGGNAYYYSINYDGIIVLHHSQTESAGYSVRCVKD